MRGGSAPSGKSGMEIERGSQNRLHRRGMARTDDMIVSAGYNIASPEVEDALMLHPAVAECAVIGTPDAERGHIVMAFVVPKAGVEANDALAQDLQNFVKQTIAPYKYPRQIRFATQLPRTQTGKLQRFKLHEWV